MRLMRAKMYEDNLKKCIDILFYLYKTKQWILDFKISGEFKIIKTQNEELYVLGSKIVKCNNLIGTKLTRYLSKQIEMFEKESRKKDASRNHYVETV